MGGRLGGQHHSCCSSKAKVCWFPRGPAKGWLCLQLLSPPLPFAHSPSLPLSVSPSLLPSKPEFQGKLCLCRETSQALIRSGQRKALSNPGSQPRGPSNGFRETKEEKTGCSPTCQEGWFPGGRVGFVGLCGGRSGSLVHRVPGCQISGTTAPWPRRSLSTHSSCLCQTKATTRRGAPG